MTISLLDLPEEVILAIISLLPATSLPCIEQTSQSLRRFALEPTVWRSLCQASYRYWNDARETKSKFQEPIGALDWKKLFVMRYLKARLVEQQLDSILSEQHGRIAKFHEIARCGYEAKDTLLKQMGAKPAAAAAAAYRDDGLCRRYYCKAVLGHIQRGLALKEWEKMILRGSRDYDGFDRALSAFDMFVIEDNEGDSDEIEGYLDKLVEKICYSIEDIQTLSIRAKSLAIVRYLRANGFNGVADERWNDLRNNFIGIALRQKEHQCLPLVSVGIFCAVARRLGLDARPCGFPFRVHAIVQGLPNESLNAVRASIRGMPNQSPNSGRSLEGGDGTVERIFLDPSRSSDEVSLESLRAQVRALGFDVSEVSVHLLDSPVSGMVHRAARNIAKAVKELNLALEMTNPNSLEPLPDMYPSKKDARYSALWALVVLEAMQLGTEPGMSMAERRQNINHMLFELSADFPCDISLLEDHVVPFFQGFEERTELNDIINAMQSTDRIPKEVKSRKVLDQDGSVKYRVGQIFKHKRYRYFGIITGWDRSCVQEEDWIQQMNVDALPNGRNQSFYHVLSWDNAIRYVAEVNIEIETQQCPDALVRIAGKHFKRWDKESMRFISNIRDEYPED